MDYQERPFGRALDSAAYPGFQTSGRNGASAVPQVVAALATARGEVDRLYARRQELAALPR